MNKYGSVLTMFLVIFIVAILGIIVYFAYDLLNSNKINDDAQTAMEELEKATSSIERYTPSTSDNSIENTTSMSDNLEEIRKAIAESESQRQTNNTKTNGEVQKVYMDKYEVLGKIEIPKTKCEYPILDDVTAGALEKSVGLVPEIGAGLNEVGNSIIFGHNYRNGLFFSNNKNLSNGDIIYITDKYGNKVTYEIYNIYQTDPTDASYMIRDTEGRREISLQTCTDDSSARIIIWAKEKI